VVSTSIVATEAIQMIVEIRHRMILDGRSGWSTTQMVVSSCGLGTRAVHVNVNSDANVDVVVDVHDIDSGLIVSRRRP